MYCAVLFLQSPTTCPNTLARAAVESNWRANPANVFDAGMGAELFRERRLFAL